MLGVGNGQVPDAKVRMTARFSNPSAMFETGQGRGWVPTCLLGIGDGEIPDAVLEAEEDAGHPAGCLGVKGDGARGPAVVVLKRPRLPGGHRVQRLRERQGAARTVLPGKRVTSVKFSLILTVIAKLAYSTQTKLSPLVFSRALPLQNATKYSSFLFPVDKLFFV